MTGTPAQAFTIGVEEEFLIVDPETRRLRPASEDVVPAAEDQVGDHVDYEFKLSQLETGTPPVRALADLRKELVELRRGVIAAAERSGTRVGAAGTHPFPHRDGAQVTPKESYLGLERDYQRLAREKIICGCHVHVGMPDEEAAIPVLNHVRPWLSVVLALAANSPFWLGEDTGYASFRTEIWRRWPTAGTPVVFASRADYERLIGLLMKTKSIDDPARVFFDVRPSARYPTLELRVTDVCLTIDESVMVAALFRGLARTAHAEAERGDPPCDPRPELLRSATWRAARYGLDDELIDVCGERVAPAEQVVEGLLGHVRPVLEDDGDWDEVSALVTRTVERGTGAARQREAFARSGRLEDVVDLVVSETAAGT